MLNVKLHEKYSTQIISSRDKKSIFGVSSNGSVSCERRKKDAEIYLIYMYMSWNHIK